MERTTITKQHTAIDDSNGHQDPAPALNHAQLVSSNRQDSATERSCSCNDAFKFLVHGPFTVSGHDHLLTFKLLRYVPGNTSGDFYPGFREESASGEHERNVDDG